MYLAGGTVNVDGTINGDLVVVGGNVTVRGAVNGELIVAGGVDDPLRSHRREVAVVFADLRGFTSFAASSDPEAMMATLREFHRAMGRVIAAHEGTLERFTGDGMMVFFNDPVPVQEPALKAARMTIEMQTRIADLTSKWRKRGFDLGFGAGIAQGYATIGAIGFEGRWDYGAIGTVTNLAARLCGEAKGGQTLISQRVLGAMAYLRPHPGLLQIARDQLGQLGFIFDD